MYRHGMGEEAKVDMTSLFECNHSLCDGQQVIPVHAFVFPDLIVGTYSACIHHNTALLVCFGVEQVVAF